MPKKKVKSPKKKRFNPKDAIRKRAPGRAFRIKKREGEPNTFAGFATFRVRSRAQALRILNHYSDILGFWQLKKDWKVKLPGMKRAKKQTGYSIAQQPKDAAGKKWNNNHLNRAIKDTAISAANKQGASKDYEGKQPEYVKSVSTGFDLIIWFAAERKRTLYSLIGAPDE